MELKFHIPYRWPAKRGYAKARYPACDTNMPGTIEMVLEMLAAHTDGTFAAAADKRGAQRMDAQTAGQLHVCPNAGTRSHARCRDGGRPSSAAKAGRHKATNARLNRICGTSRSTSPANAAHRICSNHAPRDRRPPSAIREPGRPTTRRDRSARRRIRGCG